MLGRKMQGLHALCVGQVHIATKCAQRLKFKNKSFVKSLKQLGRSNAQSHMYSAPPSQASYNEKMSIEPVRVPACPPWHRCVSESRPQSRASRSLPRSGGAAVPRWCGAWWGQW